MLGRPVVEIRFDSAELEHASTLGAAHGEGWQSIIVGDDVADQLVADQLACAVREMRRRARARRGAASGEESTGAGFAADQRASDSAERESSAQAAEEARRAERDA
jgi:hypothetical protein